MLLSKIDYLLINGVLFLRTDQMSPGLEGSATQVRVEGVESCRPIPSPRWRGKGDCRVETGGGCAQRRKRTLGVIYSVHWDGAPSDAEVSFNSMQWEGEGSISFHVGDS